MTKKLINIVLHIALILLPLLVLPTKYFPYEYNIPKMIALYSCGVILFILLLIRYKELKFDKYDILFGVFILLVILSTVFSVDVRISIFGMPNRFEGLLTFICYFLIYYCARYYLNISNKSLNIILIAISIISIIGILQYYNLITLSRYYGQSFASATFGNRNFFGSFLALVVPFTMCLYIFYNKELALIPCLLSFFALLCSLTRSAWLAFLIISIIGLIYLIILKDKRTWKRAILTIALLLMLFITFYINKPKAFTGRITSTMNDFNSIIDSIDEIKNNENENLPNQKENLLDILASMSNTIASNRMIIWKCAVKIIKHYPIFGSGPDAFFSGLCTKELDFVVNTVYHALNNGFPDKAHNEWLHIGATIGIPALIIYVTFIILILRKLRKTNLKENKISFIIYICIISYIIQSMFNISTIGVAPIYYLIIGYSLQLNNLVKLKEKN